MKESHLEILKSKLEGELHFDEVMKRAYATDASAYREIPLAVAIPKSEDDIHKLILFAGENNTSLIPRTAGTSLAGQVVGDGIIVDVSKHFNNISEPNQEENSIWVQPGVIRDELNLFLEKHNLYFGPETSTANRAMIGGMVGNNSCGSNSVIYQSTREHLLELKGFLSDGSKIHIKGLSNDEFIAKTNSADGLEKTLYSQIHKVLSQKEIQNQIISEFPKKSVTRRNTGYAVDLLLNSNVFGGDEDFNFSKLIAGSEGTLMFITDIKLSLSPRPPRHKVLLCAHFKSLYESLEANLIALGYNPSASELMDHYVLDCTKENIEHRKNRFFVDGEPEAILVVEISRESEEEALKAANACLNEMKALGYGYHFPIVKGDDIKKVWSLRKAGLGLLSNIPGDAKPAPVIEDTAVDVKDLPAYIKEFNEILDKHNLYCVHYAHAGSGELHLRPIINLKTSEGQRLFKTILEEIARLVKKYKGSLSGEHGDGRLRASFIKDMIGDQNYELIREIKNTWDPNNIFNPGKIVDPPEMLDSLRYEADRKEPEIETVLDFSNYQGILRSAEMCNGSGDCRKTHLSGGTMCPSYMATKNEKDTTRARANILREFLTNSDKQNPFDHEEIKEVMDLCLSCKACKSECPSNVDMAKMKAEFTHQYYKNHRPSLRTLLFANFEANNKLAHLFRPIYNLSTQKAPFNKVFKSFMGIADERSIPALHKLTLKQWFEKNRASLNPLKPKKRLYFFADEFTNYHDVEIGIKCIQLLVALGYEVIIPEHLESARALLSKGFVEKAAKIAEKNIQLLSGLINEEQVLIGLEPSAILTFRDEYPDLLRDDLKKKAQRISDNTFTIEEFISSEFERGNISDANFKIDQKEILIHGHCHQKALSSVSYTQKMLEIPLNYKSSVIPSGCCGMAGSFGYEKEHFKVSKDVAELVLAPRVRNAKKEILIAASGTSCRHQIKDICERESLHPVEILYDALMDKKLW